MMYLRYIVPLSILQLIIAAPQINLYYTDSVSEANRSSGLRHHCLRISAPLKTVNTTHQIVSYCLSDLSFNYHIETGDNFPKFTFAQLSQQNITSHHLYLWSAPIDIIEHYQHYLNHLSIIHDRTMDTQVFYNCTLPRFGSMCQYEIEYYQYQTYPSLYDIIYNYYRIYEYNPTNFTCYTHLQCNRGPFPACLDWTEVCNGQFDCLDNNLDEEHCWQLEINECRDGEFQCTNGQCISMLFFRDDKDTPDCLDGSDELRQVPKKLQECLTDIPRFGCDDITCRESFLTNACVKKRINLLIDAIYSVHDNMTTEKCWKAFKCLLQIPDSELSYCKNICKQHECVKIIEDTCADITFIPSVPIVLGNVYLAYTKKDARNLIKGGVGSPYFCYVDSFYDNAFISYETILFNNRTCRGPLILYSTLILSLSSEPTYFVPLNHLYSQLKPCNQVINYTSIICERSNMYQCDNSFKCISVNRLMDNIIDCPEQDDENTTSVYIISLKKRLKNHFKCKLNKTYIHPTLFDNGKCECMRETLGLCEDEKHEEYRMRKTISFQTTCDGFTELIMNMIEGHNETDETECQQWQCNNIYTRCDGIWNCPKGEDEIGCLLSITLNCSEDHHLCVSNEQNQLICLPITKINDGTIECIGGTDERSLCRRKEHIYMLSNFYCSNPILTSCMNSVVLCDHHPHCKNGDDENFCDKNRTTTIASNICSSPYLSSGTDVEKFLCHETSYARKQQIKYFMLDTMAESINYSTSKIGQAGRWNISSNINTHLNQPRCHRGLPLRLWRDNENKSIENLCLCPPSFYGNQCQYQNQRVSLTLRFRALSDSWSTLFSIMVSLMDNSQQRTIHSYEQITYLSIRDCKMKFNIYLLYSTQPKNSTNNYSINIHIYDKTSLKYRGSFLYPIQFSFLPVYRQALIIDIPRDDENFHRCSTSQCNHGKCTIYTNIDKKENMFCQCNEGWSGQYCTIRHECTCASDSLCIGVSVDNRSICVCPLHKFGPRCLLTNVICQQNISLLCQHGGQCIPTDEHMISNRLFQCICPKGYMGDRCEIEENKINLRFETNIVLSQTIFIHFIQVINASTPIRATSLRTLPTIQDSLMIYWSRPFHLVLIEFINKNYYLAVQQKPYKQSTTIEKTVQISDRCQHIGELLNKTIVKMHIIRRIKYYHLPCQIYSSNLSCFYDDIHMCLCYTHGKQRLSNCFEFNHNMTFDCLGQSVCENGGQCFQDTTDCPKKSVCICPQCYYGKRCQFRTTGLGLSLDGILGYHIQPQVGFINQPKIVKVSFSLTIIFMVVGYINGILTLITFKDKKVCEVGCGLYLFGSSITTLLMTTLLALKFWILLVTQMVYTSNRLFLQIQCICLDFFLRICLAMDQWLNACVAIERSVTVIKGATFRKDKSKRVARIVIIILLVAIIGTSIHDPIYRRIINEVNEDEKRLWCIVIYPESVGIFNSIIHGFHFLAPFMINLISAVILITQQSRRQTTLQINRTYRDLIQIQIRQHQHLLIAPVLLVVLGLPRLIISFVSKCMKSTNDAWIFLIVYFVSFIPPMLTFVLFILPSKFYKRQFHQSLIVYRTRIQRLQSN